MTEVLSIFDQYVAWYSWAKTNLVRDAVVCHTAAATAMQALAIGGDCEAAAVAARTAAGDEAAVGRTRASYGARHRYVERVWAHANLSSPSDQTIGRQQVQSRSVMQPPPLHLLRGQEVPRTSASVPTTRRRQRPAQGGDTRLVVTQITQLVAANEALQRANRVLTDENQRLRSELIEIGSAVGSPTGGWRGRGRRGGLDPDRRSRMTPC